MADQATILHADLDSFYASVEQRDDPTLRGRPVLVGGGVVLAASYEAKAFGVRTPMSLARARALCPTAIVVPPRMNAYAEASKRVFEVFHDTTPLVEGISIDEAFLEVGGLLRLSGSPTTIAARLRAEVRTRAGLPITVGVARTKFLAKVASAVGKPDGLLVVPAGEELAFLHPLPVERLWGVGPVTAGKLRERHIHTVGHIARLGEAALVALLGANAGRHLHALAHNQDPRRVRVGHRRGSVGSQSALGRGPHPFPEVEATLAALVDRVTHRMRKAGRPGRTVILRLRFADFTRATRSRSLLKATMSTDPILATARSLLLTARPLIEERGLTLVGISVGNLDSNGGVQLELPFPTPPTTHPTAEPVTHPDATPAALPNTTPAALPNTTPGFRPNAAPDSRPGSAPDNAPNGHPSSPPNTHPASTPTTQPNSIPHDRPTARPNGRPNAAPHGQSRPTPHARPGIPLHHQPTSMPNGQPNSAPHERQNSMPHDRPGSAPRGQRGSAPHDQPGSMPHDQPDSAPHDQPDPAPHDQPDSAPHDQPGSAPHDQPDSVPHDQPDSVPHGRRNSMPHGRPGAVPRGRPGSGTNDGLDAALDGVRDRFGSASVTRAAALGRRLHPSVPLLPD